MRDILQEQFVALKEKKENPSITWEDIAKIREDCTGVKESPETIRKGAKIFYEYLNAGWIAPPSTYNASKEVKSINKDGNVTSELELQFDSNVDYNDTNSLLKLHGYNPNLFTLTSAKSSKWHSGSKPMISSKISVVPKPKLSPSIEDLDKWIRHLPKELGSASLAAADSNGDKLLLLPISDLHFNLRASELSTGNTYGIEEAKKIFFGTIQDALNKTKEYKFKKILFLIGGDMLNADNPNGTTTKGTPQDNCLGYFEACESLYDMVISGIEMLLKVAPVHIIYVPGNHDYVTGYKLAKYVEAWYRNNENVSIDSSPKMRKYYRFGKTLLVFSHDADVKNLPAIVADEARNLWSKVTFTDVFLQHLHTEQVLKEGHHMRIQRLPTASGLSKWAADSGYGAMRTNKSFVYDKTNGREMIIYSNFN